MTTVATVLALGIVTPIALQALPLHLALGAGTIVGVGGVAAIVFKMTGALPRIGETSLRTCGLSAVSGVSLSLFGAGFMALEKHFLPFWSGQFDQHAAAMESIVRPDDPSYVPLVLLTVALLPAVFEEVLFRGVLTRYLGAHLSKIGVVLTVGLLFAILHVSPVVLLPLAYVGGLWTVLAQRTGGWGASAVSHFFMNAASAALFVHVIPIGDPSIFVALIMLAFGSTLATASILSVHERTESSFAAELDT